MTKLQPRPREAAPVKAGAVRALFLAIGGERFEAVGRQAFPFLILPRRYRWEGKPTTAVALAWASIPSLIVAWCSVGLICVLVFIVVRLGV